MSHQDDDNKPKSGEEEGEDWNFQAFTFEKKDAESQAPAAPPSQSENTGSNSDIERDETRKSSATSTSSASAPAKTQGAGENVFEFDFDDVPICPCIKVKLNVKDTLCFEIGKKLILGSDPTQCKVTINHSSISPIHCIFGVKDGAVLLKHISPHGVFLKGKRLEAGKTYKLPYNDMIKVGAIYVEILRTRPLDIQVVEVNRNWKADLEEDKPMAGASTFLEDRKKKQEEKNKSFLSKIFAHFFGIFDARDEKEIEEEEDDTKWVTAEEWKNAPEAERSNLKVVKEDELVDRNFKVEDKSKIKQANILVRPWLKLWHGIRDEFSIFDAKRKNNLDQQIEAQKRKLEEMKIAHLCQAQIFTPTEAKKLVSHGVQTIAHAAKLTDKELAKITGSKKEEVAAKQQKIAVAVEKGTISKSSKEVAEFEKKVEFNQAKVETKERNLQTAGPLKRIAGTVGNFLSIFGLLYTLWHFELSKNFYDQQLAPVINSCFAYLVSLPGIKAQLLSRETLDFFAIIFPFIFFHISLQVVSHLLVGLTPGQFFLGLRNNRSFLSSRFLGLLRYLIGVVTGPFLIFDLPILFKMKSLKELLSFNTLVRRKSRSVFVELASTCIFFLTSLYGTGACVLYLKESNQKKMFLLPTDKFIQLGLPLLEKIEFFTVDQYKMLREQSNIEFKVENLGKIKILKGDVQVIPYQINMPDKHTDKLSIYSFHWLQGFKGDEILVETKNGVQLTLVGPFRVLFDKVVGGQELLLYMPEGELWLNSEIKGTSQYIVSGNTLFDVMEGQALILNRGHGEILVSVVGTHHMSYIYSLAVEKLNSSHRARNILGQMMSKGTHIRPVKPGCFSILLPATDYPSVSVRYSAIDFKKFLGAETITSQSYGCRPVTVGLAKWDETHTEYTPVPGGKIDLAEGKYIMPSPISNYISELEIFELQAGKEMPLDIKVESDSVLQERREEFLTRRIQMRKDLP